MRKYIHYGHSRFMRELFQPIRNQEFFTKPMGGLWASPVDADFGWKTWNDNEHFRECSEDNSFTFSLTDSAKVYRIYSVGDLKRLPEYKNYIVPGRWYCIDFEKCVELGYDAIELHISEEERIDDAEPFECLYFRLYGWDCDSILIMNPDVVEV